MKKKTKTVARAQTQETAEIKVTLSVETQLVMDAVTVLREAVRNIEGVTFSDVVVENYSFDPKDVNGG